ncbi:hypothetical protein BOX15_Mlig032506g1, partial [Macrostomum lignano]
GGGTASNSSKWDWKTIALVSVPVAGLGLGVAYYYFYHRRSQNAEKGEKKKSVEESTGQSSQEASPPPSQQQPQQQQQQPATPLEAALQVKERGNKYYRGGRYDKAIECYSEAIDLCPPDQSDTLSTFYQNRAAALESLGKWDDVERDCTSALEHSPRYTKALARRAKVRERLGELRGALVDITAVCILESFSNSDSLTRAEQVLKSRGRQLAKESASRIVPSLPSKAFLRSFFMSFSEDPVQREPIGSDPFSAALQALSDDKFDQLIGLCEEALKAPVHSNGSAQTPSSTASAEASQAAGESGDEPQPQEQQQEQQAAEKQSYLTPYRRDLCRLFLATLQLLSGQPLSAEPTLKSLANSNDVDRSVRANALIKLASLAMQAAMPGQTDVLTDSVLGHFDRALQLCPDHPDAHHHRGQMLLLTDRLDEALVHLTKACEGAPANPIPAVQRAYASHRTGSGANALDQLRRLTEKHRRCGEAHSLYAQALLETQQFDEAEKAFKRVTELEPDSGTAYVHQGLLRLQAHNDTEGGVALIQRALEVEPRCEFALETLATIEVQRGNLDAAIGLFDRAIALTKTEAELAHLWALREAADVQLQLARDMGLRMPSLAAGMHQAF